MRSSATARLHPARDGASLRARVARLAWLSLLLVGAGGCLNWFPQQVVSPEAAFAPVPVMQNNPTLIANQDRDMVFEAVVDVVEDYFKIEREVPVRLEGDVLVEGQIESFPRGGSTLLEPWNKDSINYYERMESTLQSIRRRAVVRVIPSEAGFLVDVAVFKDLEDVARPESGSASRAPNLRNDNALRRYVDPVGGTQPNVGWIPLGRDIALEQLIIAQLQAKASGFVTPGMAPLAIPAATGPPVQLPPGTIGPPAGGIPYPQPGAGPPPGGPPIMPTPVPPGGASPFNVPPGAGPPIQ